MTNTHSDNEDIAQAKALQHLAEQRAADLAKANDALQTTIDALSGITHPNQIVPRVLEIVAKTFNSTSCAVFKNDPSGTVWLQYWFSAGKTYPPEEMLLLDPEKFGLVRTLADGFEVPDSYLGGPPNKVIGPVVLNHFTGTSVAEFDEFAIKVGWDHELNIGVASKGIRAFTLCIYRSHNHDFADSEIILAEALAKQLGLAMETCRLIEEAKQSAIEREQKRAALIRSEELERASIALQETIDEVSKLQTLDDFIPHALRIVAKAFGVESAGYFEHPAEFIYLRFWLHQDTIYGPSDLPGLESTHLCVMSQLAAGFTVPEAHLGVDYRRRIHSSIIHHRTATASPPLHAFAVSMGWDWELNVPLMVNGLADGAITLFRPENKPFTEADCSLAESLGKQIALAMNISQIAEREREITVQYERQEAAQLRVNAIASERERIARDIHDTLAQGFTAILIHLKTLRKQFSLPADAIETIDALQHLAQDNLIEARRSLGALRPRLLDHNNLPDALHQLINSVERVGDIQIELAADKPLPTMPEHVEDELLRIAQEALQNALRYGQGKAITIALMAMDEDGVNLSIIDDGRGFNPETITLGYGLTGMQERAERIGAALTVISEPGYGTQIITTWMPTPILKESQMPSKDKDKDKFKVLVADDHAIFRKGLVSLLKQVADFAVVAEARDGLEAVELYKKHQPHIVLLDLQMPKMRGVEAVKAIRKADPEAKIIILTTFDMDEDIQQALKAGAKSYLLKDIDADDLVQTMREVMSGKISISATVAAKLAERLTQLQLTAREHAVLKLVAEQSMPNKLIAEQLGISEATVKTHLTNLFEKLGVNSRTEAIAVAVRRGLVSLKL